MTGWNHNGESLGGALSTPQLWLVPWATSSPQGLSNALADGELRWAEALPPARRLRYIISRAALRYLLSAVLDEPPLQVPLHSPPGQPPQLPGGLGFVSLSHGRDAVLLAWAPEPIGVDLEAADRRFEARALMQRFFAPQEQEQLQGLAAEPLRQAVLRSWLVKEAAIKWRQRSLAADLMAWSFDHYSGLLHHRDDRLVLKPSEGNCLHWRWAAVGESLQGLEAGPLVWRFEA